jgi:hypothetical protein
MSGDGYWEPALFELDPTPRSRVRPKGLRSVAQGTCPICLVTSVGLVRQGNHVVWRLHSYMTWGGTRMPCPTSGVAVCVAPEQKPLHPNEPVRCGHQ